MRLNVTINIKQIVLKTVSTLTVLTICLLFVAGKNQQKTIVLVADEWCPYNCLPESDKPGYVIEIAKKIFEPLGYEVIYETTSWNRAIDGARKGVFDGIIGAEQIEAPDFVFPESEMGLTVNCFYVSNSSQWQYTGLKSLENITIGVIDNYTYGNLYTNYIESNLNNFNKVQILTGHDALSRNIKKLVAGRIDATIEDRNVINHYLNNNQLAIKEAGVLSSEKIYLAFSPVGEKSIEYALIFDAGITKMRNSGELSSILAKYNIKDWR